MQSKDLPVYSILVLLGIQVPSYHDLMSHLCTAVYCCHVLQYMIDMENLFQLLDKQSAVVDMPGETEEVHREYVSACCVAWLFQLLHTTVCNLWSMLACWDLRLFAL